MSHHQHANTWALLVVTLSCACGGELDSEATGPPRQGELEPGPSAAPEAPGSLLLEASYAGREPAPLVAWLSPLTTSAGASCSARCAFAPARCDPECQPRWAAEDTTAEWPGTASVYIGPVPSAHYWLFAYLSLEGGEDAPPVAGDPVSRAAPLLVELRPQQPAHVSLALDARFAPAASAARRSECPLRLDGNGPGSADEAPAGTATARELRAACSER